MGYSLGQVEQDYANDSQDWLASADGTEFPESGTLDADKFLATFADGIVPSGVALAKITATGLLAPYTDLATHGAGTDAFLGHLFHAADLKGITGGTAQDTVVSYLTRCKVIVAKLPTGHGLTDAARADAAGRIQYR